MLTQMRQLGLAKCTGTVCQPIMCGNGQSGAEEIVMQRRFGFVVAGLALTVGLGAAPPATASPPKVCEVTWGSLAKSQSDYSPYPVTNARAGQQPCFDRFVIDLDGPAPGYDVRYMDGPVYFPGSHSAQPLRGGARLRVVVHAEPYGENGLTFADRNAQELVNVSGYRTFRQIAFLPAADYWPGETYFGVGVRSRLPFRTFVLEGPGNTSRIIVDVAHQW